MLSLAEALAWSSRLVALSVALQTLELLWLRRAFAPGAPLAGLAKGGVVLLLVQLGLCGWIAIVGASALSLLLFASYWLVIARLGAPFNGGSDALSSLSLLMLGLAALGRPGGVFQFVALGYLGVQTVFSYFVAGLAKLKERGWRRGTALVHFARLPKYGVPAWARALLARPSVALAASWAILAFECSFPYALRGERVCLVYLTLGACFHLGNAWLFGLNRFLFSWLAVYPVLLALTGPLPWVGENPVPRPPLEVEGIPRE
jgi:hypothetical protein